MKKIVRITESELNHITKRVIFEMEKKNFQNHIEICMTNYQKI
jgi:hypothetical protein